jgi:hypothetical protein
MTRDQNGRPIRKNIARESAPRGDAPIAWGVTVWFGGWNGLGTDVRRYFYRTRDEARKADISDRLGQRGRVW